MIFFRNILKEESILFYCCIYTQLFVTNISKHITLEVFYYFTDIFKLRLYCGTFQCIVSNAFQISTGHISGMNLYEEREEVYVQELNDFGSLDSNPIFFVR